MVMDRNAVEWAPVWQCQCDDGHWAGYTLEESQSLDNRMTMGEIAFYMTAHKWINYVFVLNGFTSEVIAYLRGNPAEYQMFQYNKQSQKQRRMPRIIVLID
jgi:hypothetical protein